MYYFIIMGNVFNTGHEIHKRYDIKGSLFNRSTPTKYNSFIYPLTNPLENVQVSAERTKT